MTNEREPLLNDITQTPFDVFGRYAREFFSPYFGDEGDEDISVSADVAPSLKDGVDHHQMPDGFDDDQ